MDIEKLMAILEKMLIVDEGCELKPYKDSVGKLTIGIGRNLDDVGIRLSEAKVMLQNDAMDSLAKCMSFIPFFRELDQARQCVLLDMAFNLGIQGLLKFKKMLQAVKDGDYQLAALEMFDSRWHIQVGKRADRLEEMMRTGEIHKDYKGV